MSRSQILKTVAAIWLTAFMMNSAHAQLPEWANNAGSTPVQLTGGIQPTLLPEPAPYQAIPVSNVNRQDARMMWAPEPINHCTPHTGAPLYPSPVPNVPYQVGTTLHTNQALYPHEMLYPHRYTAMYPPFYYVVRGGWIVTPWGVRSHDNWYLEGTRVDVKYRSNYGLFSGFHGIKRYSNHH